MSKRLLTGLLVASLSLVFLSCDEEENNKPTRPSKTQEGDACTASKCASTSTLMKCVDGVAVKETCRTGYKCSNGECIPKPPPSVPCEPNSKPKCSDNGVFVQTCVDGLLQSEECEYGCAGGKCEPACSFTEKRCNNGNTAIVECKDGVIVEVEQCKCNLGECLKTCGTPGNRCDGNTMISCGEDGYALPTSCPNGCNAATGTCNERCEAGCSKDGKSLINCEGGKTLASTPCQYGCRNSKCLTEEESGGGGGGGDEPSTPGGSITITCGADPIRCTMDGNAVDCTGNEPVLIKCDYGCDHGKCIDAVEAPTCSDANDFCDTFGQMLYYCIDGKQAKTNCEFGCTDGKCNDKDHAINCTEGSAACAPGDSMLQHCVNNELILEPCLNGCKDDACVVKEQGTDPCLTDSCVYFPHVAVRRCVNGFYQDEPCDGICTYDAYKKGTVECVPEDYCVEDAQCNHLKKTRCDLDKHQCY